MTVALKITVAFNESVSDYLNKIIEISDSLAEEKHIKTGATGVLFEDDEILKITYRGAYVELPKSGIRVLSVGDA